MAEIRITLRDPGDADRLHRCYAIYGEAILSR
jgi:hypothetical protein